MSVIERFSNAVAKVVAWYIETSEAMRFRLATPEELEEWNRRFASSTKWTIPAEVKMHASDYAALVDKLTPLGFSLAREIGAPELPEGTSYESWLRSKRLYELAELERSGDRWPRGALPLTLLEVSRHEFLKRPDVCRKCEELYQECCCPTHQRGED